MLFPHVFNADNDMALADFRPGFTPPARIQLMMDELADFARLWDGPWGWSPALCHRLARQGVDAALLPSHDWLVRLRALSSRQTAVDLLRAFQAEHAGYVGASRMCHTVEEVDEAVRTYGRFILKQPWSSSGKGLRLTAPYEAWVRRTLRAQGGVVVEPLYDKVLDFAMEFESDGAGCVRYVGLSLFTTTPTGAYRGNLIAPEAEKMAHLAQHVPLSRLGEVRAWLEKALAQTLSTDYAGPLGVDMMLTREGFHPLVEVNLRMTMGRVAHILQQKKPATRGELILEYAPGQPLPEGAELLAGGAHYRVYVTGGAGFRACGVRRTLLY